jgi:uncharacterized protein
MARTPAQPIPSSDVAVRDLTDAEFAELDDLLAATPEPLQPLDVVMLDGYLCGVLVQPVLIGSEQWLPPVFDLDGRSLPEDHDPAWLARACELMLRRHAALNRALVEDGWFDPLVLDLDGDDEDEAPDRPEATTDAGSGAESAEEPAISGDTGEDDPDGELARLSPVSRPLVPWVAGFHHATDCFPDLLDLPHDDIDLALARLYRHLPAQSDEEREIAETLDREHPLADLDAAIEELVVTIADLADLTRDSRYRVEQVQRSTPKIGRNDPCHCGSGRKCKHCHGA